MNYDFLWPEKPLPIFFRILSLIIIFLSLLTGIYLKLGGMEELYHFSLDDAKFCFLAALVILIFSKSKIIDERSQAIRLQVFRLGFRFLLAIILLMEFNFIINNNPKSYGMFYYFVVSIVGFLAILTELSKNSNLIDLAENYPTAYKISMGLIMILILLFNQWLW